MTQATQPIPDLTTLPLEQKAAQMVMIDVPGTALDLATAEHLKAYPWNGVILFAKNVSDRAKVINFIEQLQGVSPIPLTLSVDQEGGLVDRFRFAEMTLSPGLMALAASGDRQATLDAHRIMGRELASLGIHLDFAPCLDVNNNPRNPIIGVRSFGDQALEVAQHGQAAIRGLREGGVGSTAKHFPGHGDTQVDSHIDLPTVPHSRERLEKVELVPFRAAIEEKVDAIMTAHITFPAIDPREGIPATLSHPILTGLLRQEMGFEGLIVTDSMAMQAVADRFGVAEGAVLSVEAGADIVLACGAFENQLETVRGLVEAVRSGRLDESRLDRSLERIQRFKEKYHQLPEASPSYDQQAHREVMAGWVDSTITMTKDEQSLVPLTGKTLVLMPDLLPQTPLGEMARSDSLASFLDGIELEEARYHTHADGPALTRLADRAPDFDQVVIAVYGRDRLPDSQKELIRLLLAKNPRLVVVSLSSPYLLLDIEAPTFLLAYNYTPLTLQALAKVLTGQLEAKGILPVSI